MIGKVYSEIANRLAAIANCQKSNNQEWLAKHGDVIKQIVGDFMPSGSGIDCGTKLDMSMSTPDRLVFNAPFHHMNESGMYDGWTDHAIIVTPSLAHGFNMRITGRDKNGVKEYYHDVFGCALNTSIAYANSPDTQKYIEVKAVAA